MSDPEKTAQQEQMVWVYPVFWDHLKKVGCGTAYAGDGNGPHADGVERQPLYTRPVQKPLTTGQITAGIDLDSMSAVEISAFYAGIRWAEEQHGIGGKA